MLIFLFQKPDKEFGSVQIADNIPHENIARILNGILHHKCSIAACCSSMDELKSLLDEADLEPIKTQEEMNEEAQRLMDEVSAGLFDHYSR